MVTVLEASFSDLINRPKHTLANMARVRLLWLRRRNDEDLVLTTASRYQQEHTVVSATTRLAVALMRSEPEHELLLRVMPEVFPWVRYLPPEDTKTFLEDLVGTLRALEDLDNIAPVAQLITEWRHTADVAADPEVAAILAQDGDDYGPVPEPVVNR